MLETETLKKIVYRLIDFVNPQSTVDIFMNVIDRYAGSESYSNDDMYESIIEEQLALIEKTKEDAIQTVKGF